MASVTKRQWTHNGVTKSAWTVRYVDMGGVHRSKGFPTKKEADAYRAKVESDIRRGILAPQADQITVGEAADEFLKHMAHRVKDGRIGEDYRVHIERFIKLHVLPHLQRAKLSAVNLDMLTKWHRDIHKARKISPATGRNAAQALKQIFDFAIRREWTHRNPVLPLLAEMRGIEPAKVRTFSVDEMRALLNALEIPMYRGRRPEAALRLKIAVHLAVFCSLRIGEIHGLRIDQLSLEAGTLRVNSNLARYGGLKGPKSRAGNRILAMPRHVVAMLEEWMALFYRENPAGLVFVQKNGQPRNQDGTRHGAWAGLLHRAGLSDDPRKPSFHFHALRHFFASWAIDAGWALTEAARAMGHSKVDMTLSVYAHALRNQGADATAMQSLSDRLLLPPPAQELRNAA